MAVERRSVSEIPQHIHDRVADEILRYSVGLTKINKTVAGEEVNLIGSGTLVTVCGRLGILTADHVIEVLKGSDLLGVMCDINGPLKRHVIPVGFLGLKRIARGEVESDGPDLAFIELPEEGIAYIKSSKVFYNLDKRMEEFSAGFLPVEVGAWFGFGVIGETERDLTPEGSFTSVRGYEAMCGMGGTPKEVTRAEFDYIEISVDWSGREADIPRSFGGMSGGGVWQVPIDYVSNEYKSRAPILAGVVFYQSPVERGRRRLICHGRLSVYNRVREVFRT